MSTEPCEAIKRPIEAQMQLTASKETSFLENLCHVAIVSAVFFAISLAAISAIDAQYFPAFLFGIPTFFVAIVFISSLFERRKILRGISSKKTFSIIENDLGFTESAGLRIISLCYTAISSFLQGLCIGLVADVAFTIAAFCRNKLIFSTTDETLILAIAFIFAIIVNLLLQVVNRLFFENAAMNLRLRDAAIRFYVSSYKNLEHIASHEAERSGDDRDS